MPESRKEENAILDGDHVEKRIVFHDTTVINTVSHRNPRQIESDTDDL